MSSVSPSQVGDASRVALARLALDVISTMPDVAGTDVGPGGLCVTADPPFGVLQGVSVIAQSDGRYEVDLCLVARMVPLPSLGDEIRHRLRTRATRAGLAGQLGTVNVEFAQALGPGETLPEVHEPEAAVGAEAGQVGAGSPSSSPMPADSQIPPLPIPPTPPPGLPDEPEPGPTGSPAPPPTTAAPPTAPPPRPTAAPPPTTRPASIPPAGTPPEPTGLIGAPTPPRDPVGSPIPSSPPGYLPTSPSSERERGS